MRYALFILLQWICEIRRCLHKVAYSINSTAKEKKIHQIIIKFSSVHTGSNVAF